MIFNPWRRQEPLDRSELERLLPPPGFPVLSDDRQRLLEDHLMSNMTEDSRRAGARRRLAVRVAVPVALAAAIAGTALGVRQTTAQNDAPGTAAAGRAPQHISTVAYTLDREKQGTVTVTIRQSGASQPDAAQLQRDLDRMGVPSRVYVNAPRCTLDTGSPYNPVIDAALWRAVRFSHRNGAFIATLKPDKFPPGTHLMVDLRPYATGEDADVIGFDLREGTGPDCVSDDVTVGHIPTPATPTSPGTPTPSRRG